MTTEKNYNSLFKNYYKVLLKISGSILMIIFLFLLSFNGVSAYQPECSNVASDYGGYDLYTDTNGVLIINHPFDENQSLLSGWKYANDWEIQSNQLYGDGQSYFSVNLDTFVGNNTIDIYNRITNNAGQISVYFSEVEAVPDIADHGICGFKTNEAASINLCSVGACGTDTGIDISLTDYYRYKMTFDTIADKCFYWIYDKSGTQLYESGATAPYATSRTLAWFGGDGTGAGTGYDHWYANMSFYETDTCPAGSIPPIENFQITSTDSETNSIDTFNVTIDTNTFYTTNGTAYTDKYLNDTSLWDVLVSATNFFPRTYSNLNISTALSSVLYTQLVYNESWNMTSDGGCIEWQSNQSVNCDTTDGTPTVVFDTNINQNCSMSTNNYAVYNDTRKCSTTSGTEQVCTIYNADKLVYGTQNLYVQCENDIGDDSLSGALAINMTAGSGGGEGLISCIKVIGDGCAAEITDGCAAIIQS